MANTCKSQAFPSAPLVLFLASGEKHILLHNLFLKKKKRKKKKIVQKTATKLLFLIKYRAVYIPSPPHPPFLDWFSSHNLFSLHLALESH